MTSQLKTGTHPFYIGMYIHIYIHIYMYIYILLRRNVYVFFPQIQQVDPARGAVYPSSDPIAFVSVAMAVTPLWGCRLVCRLEVTLLRFQDAWSLRTRAPRKDGNAHNKTNQFPDFASCKVIYLLVHVFHARVSSESPVVSNSQDSILQHCELTSRQRRCAFATDGCGACVDISLGTLSKCVSFLQLSCDCYLLLLFFHFFGFCCF